MTQKTVKSVLAVAFLLLLAAALPATAKETRITRFANPRTAFHLPALKSGNDARAMLEKRKMDIQVVLQAASAGSIDDLLHAAETGTFSEGTIQPGTQMPFMALRRKGKPAVLWNVTWAGKQSVPTYTLEYESGGHRYRIVIPKPCSNFWVEDLGAGPPPPTGPSLQVPNVRVCATQPVALTVNVQNATGSVNLTVNGQQVTSGAVTDGTFRAELPPFQNPGNYEVTAAIGDTRGTGTVTVVACPPTCALSVTPQEVKSGQGVMVDASGSSVDPNMKTQIKTVTVQVLRDGEQLQQVDLAPPTLTQTVPLKKAGTYTFRATVTDEAGQTSTNTCEASVTATKRPLGFFVDVDAGKERMIRSDFISGRCAALIGAKFGILPRIGEHAEFEAAIGAKINLRDSDNSAIFGDVALNGVSDKGFVGAGVSFWDLNLDDTRTVALLVHGGFAVSDSGKYFIVIEGRVPFDQFDDISNNYMFWGGVRIKF